MAKTKAPTGLTISRNGNKFTCSWKFGDTSYDDGQRFWYRLRVNDSWQSWTEISILPNATSVVVENVPIGRFYPNSSKKLYGLQFCVRGKKADYSWSSDTYCMFSTRTPQSPTVSSTLTSSNVFKATFDTNTSDDDNVIFMRYAYQTILVEDSDVSNGS